MRRTAIRRLRVSDVFTCMCALVMLGSCARPPPDHTTMCEGGPYNHPLTHVRLDPQGKLPFAPSKPFQLQFGRGSTWSGYDTVTIGKTGHVVLHQKRRAFLTARGEIKPWRNVLRDGEYVAGMPMAEYWERAELELSDASVRRLGMALVKEGVPGMASEYRADSVCDGAQWILRLQQDGRWKRIYCSNHFPEGLQDFAAAVDAELEQAGLATAPWKRVPANQDRRHEKSLWYGARP